MSSHPCKVSRRSAPLGPRSEGGVKLTPPPPPPPSKNLFSKSPVKIGLMIDLTQVKVLMSLQSFSYFTLFSIFYYELLILPLWFVSDNKTVFENGNFYVCKGKCMEQNYKEFRIKDIQEKALLISTFWPPSMRTLNYQQHWQFLRISWKILHVAMNRKLSLWTKSQFLLIRV